MYAEPPMGFDLVPPEEAIDQALEGLDADRTLVIVLSQLGFAADRNLAVNLDEVQVVLEGVPYPGFTEVTEFGESLVCRRRPAGNRWARWAWTSQASSGSTRNRSPDTRSRLPVFSRPW